MSTETYEMPSARNDLYRLLDKGRAAAEAGNKRPYLDVFNEIEKEIADVYYKASV